MADIQVVSRVMNLLGRQPITSIHDDDWGPIIDAEVDIQNRVMLEARTWEFSRRFAGLNQVTTNQNPKWKYEYQLPADFIMKIDLYNAYLDSDAVTVRAGDPIPYQDYEITNNLYTNRDSMVIEYVARSDDTETRSATYIQALAYKVASEMAPVLLNKADMAQYYFNKHLKYEADARMTDFRSVGKPDTWKVTRRSL